MKTEWQTTTYEEGWVMQLPEGNSAWIYRPTQPKRVDYFIVTVCVSGQPTAVCSSRLSSEDPKVFLPEATRFLHRKGFIMPELLIAEKVEQLELL